MSAAATCPACRGALEPWRFGLERCAECGTAVTVAPAPEDARGYGTDRPRLAGLATPVLDAYDRARLRLLGRVAPPPGRLVDVGAGRGRFVAAARNLEYDAQGIEPSPGAVAAAGELYAVRLREVDVSDARFDGLDAVCLWHVLEHLDDPAAALDHVCEWLRPGGALLVGVPNLASVQARIGGARWFHLDVPRHRVHFTPKGLRRLLARCGFEVVAERRVMLEHNPFGMWQTLVNRVAPTPNWLFRALQRDAPVRVTDALVTVLALPLVPVAALFELACGLAGRGGTIGLVARRAG